MARKKTLEQHLIGFILEHGLERVESALRMYREACGLSYSTRPTRQKGKAQESKAKAATVASTITVRDDEYSAKEL